MVVSKAPTVKAYLASLEPDRRAQVETVRSVILKHIDPTYEEGMQYGMIGYYVPHRVFPAGYHCDPRQPLPFAGLASQKNNLSLYLMGLYCGCGEAPGKGTSLAAWFREEWKKTGKKMDMGKSCIRFKRAEDLPLTLIGELIARMPARAYIAKMQENLATSKPGKPSPKRRTSAAGGT